MNTNLKHCAHIGDAVWELFVREHAIKHGSNQKQLHNLTVKFVNAPFQAELMMELEPHLTEEELEIARRARNLPLNVNKKSNPQIHAAATSFETLIGYFYFNNKSRLNEVLEKGMPFLEKN